MRNAATILLIVLACLGFGQAENPQLRKEIQQVYAAFDRAVAAENTAKILSFLDPSFVAVDENGKSMDLKEFKAMMSSMHGNMKDFRTHITVNQVQGNTSEAFAWLTMQHSFSAKEGGRWKKYSMTDKFVETLKRTPSGWKITYSQVQPKG